jgi:hypothetical protein
LHFHNIWIWNYGYWYLLLSLSNFTKFEYFFYNWVHINGIFILLYLGQHTHKILAKVWSCGILRLIKSCVVVVLTLFLWMSTRKWKFYWKALDRHSYQTPKEFWCTKSWNSKINNVMTLFALLTGTSLTGSH